MVTPDSEPAKPVLETLAPKMSMVQALATAVPEAAVVLLLITVLNIVRVGTFASMSSLVMVQVSTSPALMVPEQSDENELAYHLTIQREPVWHFSALLRYQA